MSFHSTPILSRATKTTSPPLQQFRLDESELSSSSTSDIQVCVESVVFPNTEELCAQMLMRKCTLQLFFSKWKLLYISTINPVFDKDELSGIKAQSEKNASEQLRRTRRRFLAQYSNLATISLQKMNILRHFNTWRKAYKNKCVLKLKESTVGALSLRKMLETPIHTMRSSVLRTADSQLQSVSKSVIHASTTEQLREISNRIKKENENNSSLEASIAAKSAQLDELKLQLKMATTECAESEKQLSELKESTISLQASIPQLEKQYQDEVASLWSQLKLAERENDEELERVTKQLEKQTEDRNAANAFVDDAHAASQTELAQQQEKLQKAQVVVKNLKELYDSSSKRNQELESTKQMMQNRLKAVEIKKRQMEASLATERSSMYDHEGNLKKMLADVQDKLKSAMSRIEAQADQIQSKQHEIELLQEDIQNHNRRTQKVRENFLKNVRRSPRQQID